MMKKKNIHSAVMNIQMVSQYELLKRKALQVEIENLQLKINDLENENKEGD